LIELRGVTKRFGEFTIRNVDLKVEEGEYFIIMGPTGSGKTLLLQLIAGIYRPDRGRIIIGGEDVTDKPPERRGVGYVPQNYALFRNMSVYDNIAYGLRVRGLRGWEVKRRVEEVAEVLDIKHLLKREVHGLSGGEQQRIALARALVVGFKVMLLDEPLSALDPYTSKRLRGFLREVHERFSSTTIHVTHDFDEAYELGDRVAVMRSGEIEQVGKPSEVVESPLSLFVAEFVGWDNIFKGKAEKGAVKVYGLGVLGNLLGHWAGGSEVYVAFRAEDVEVTNDEGLAMGVVESVSVRGLLCEASIRVGDLVVKARRPLSELRCSVGEKVWINIPKSRIKVFPST